MIPLLAVIAGLILLGLLLFLFNGLWIYAVWDRATRNGRDSLPREYEIPRYYAANSMVRWITARNGRAGTAGTFSLSRTALDLPLRMVRASLMTGLYGLEGIDNYERLRLKLSSLEAAEALSLIPTAVRASGGNRETEQPLTTLSPEGLRSEYVGRYVGHYDVGRGCL